MRISLGGDLLRNGTISMLYSYDSIRTVHLEITDKCNAACPMCARSVFGGQDNPYLPDRELSLDDCKGIFDVPFVSQLNKMFMCGNYGDPISARDTLEVYEYFRQHNSNIKLGMNSNGSARKPDWWKQLGSLLSNNGSYVKFGIDGLSDTNHIYRRRTNYDRIIENMQAFIAGGGKAHWDFIVFRHNEHQVEEAREIAAKLGVTQFQVKKTARFFSNTKLVNKDQQEVNDKDGNLEYYIEKPLNPEYQNNADQSGLTAKYGSMENYLDAVGVSCKTGNEKSLFVSSEGLAFPCCWTANQMYLWYFPEKSAQIWQHIESVGGKAAIDATEHPLRDIVEGPFFNAIEESWSKPSCALGKLKVCAKTCGVEMDLFKGQFA